MSSTPSKSSRLKHLAMCSIPRCKQTITSNTSLHVFPNSNDPRRKQWIRILKVEKDVPRHYRICSKHFKSSDFFPRHQLQKKLMLRPTAVPTENLPKEITDATYLSPPDSPENTCTSYASLNEQSDSNIIPIIEFTDTNGQLSLDNLSNHFNYHNSTFTPSVVTPASNISSTNFLTDELIALETVPYAELKEEKYSLFDSEIDSSSIIFQKDDDNINTGDTIQYTISYLDY